MLIKDYRLVDDFRTAGAGQSRWAFAHRGDRMYFLKEFLKPTYPVADAPGSAKVKAEKLRRCEAFEKRHLAVKQALDGSSAEGGNLIVAAEFFRAGTKYYKSTVKVDVSSLSIEDVAAMPLTSRLVVLVTVAHSLGILHRRRLVHGDLKPDNILLKAARSGTPTAKLIDFDDAFFETAVPPRDELVGDMVYYSPELLDYVTGDGPAARITTYSDVFALGLIFTQYLSGRLPAWDRRNFTYPAVAAAAGHQPEVRGLGIAPPLERLIARMIATEPEARPTVDRTWVAVKYVRANLRDGAFVPGSDTELNEYLSSLEPLKTGTRGPAVIDPAARGLKGSLHRPKSTIEPVTPRDELKRDLGLRGRLVASPEPVPEEKREESRTSVLRGKLIDRRVK